MLINTNITQKVYEFANFAAIYGLVVTPARAGQLVGVHTNAATKMLSEGLHTGLFRYVPNPFRTRGAAYQPTAMAVEMRSFEAPSVLRADASEFALYHAWLRAEIMSLNPGERWLPQLATVDWLDRQGIARRGHATPLVAFLPRRKIVYETVLPWERPDAAIRRIGKRWAPVLDDEGSEPILVRLAAPSRAVLRLQDALDRVFPLEAARRRLEDLQVAILGGEDPDVVAAAREAVDEKLTAARRATDCTFPYLLPTALGLSVWGR